MVAHLALAPSVVVLPRREGRHALVQRAELRGDMDSGGAALGHAQEGEDFGARPSGANPRASRDASAAARMAPSSLGDAGDTTAQRASRAVATRPSARPCMTQGRGTVER